MVLLAFMIVSCASEPSCEVVSPDAKDGFIAGLIHGIVFPFALIGKLFGVDTGLYSVNNTGFWYFLGFFIGVGGFSGGASKAGSVRRKRRS